MFVDDPERGVIDIYTPTSRLPFAGHPCVGAAWLLNGPELVTPAGVVSARSDEEVTWIEARAEWAPPRTLRQYGSAAEVEALSVPPLGEWIYAWAWEDESDGRVKARGFPGRGDGIEEDEATGAAALLLTSCLGRALSITQGRGSRIVTAPRSGCLIEVGRTGVFGQPTQFVEDVAQLARVMGLDLLGDGVAGGRSDDGGDRGPADRGQRPCAPPGGGWSRAR